MRLSFRHVEQYRKQFPGVEPTRKGDRFGVFIHHRPNMQIRMIVDDGAETGWEHVSVSVKIQKPDGEIIDYMPSWDVMKLAKETFWEDEECVIQFHPPASVYVDTNPFVLHLWRRVGLNWDTPPTELV